MDQTTILGIHCVCGVNERCWATQYQTNPVAYYVPTPFTNPTVCYLDQSMMQTLDSKAKTLIPHYVNTNTVYDGTTNIVMLVVTSLWAELEIGDHTNQFTGTPAIGTNPPTYGDYPWRIYPETLEERYKMLNALKVSCASGRAQGLYQYGHFSGSATNWESVQFIVEAIYDTNFYSSSYYPLCYSLADQGMSAGIYEGELASCSITDFLVFCTNFTSTGRFFVHPYIPDYNWTFDDNGLGVVTGVWNEISLPFGLGLGVYPVWADAPVDVGANGKWKGFRTSLKGITTWNFNYCTNKYW